MNPNHIQSSDIAEFASNKVNLTGERESKCRAQARGVREHIEAYISENPDIGFVKTLLSGSLAKNTALKSLHDIDIALYVKAGDQPNELNEILKWTAERLRRTYSKTPIVVDPPCVRIEFSGTDLDVEVMPVLDEGNKLGYGTIWDPYSQKKKYTSIPRHIEFFGKRKTKQTPHFAQVARLLKYWRDAQGLDFRSFLIELVLVELSDSGIDFSDYPSALLSFFNRVLSDDLEERILFTDYFPESKYPKERTNSPIEIWDPVTPDNNVASDCSTFQRDELLRACEEAADNITYAATATQKGEAIECWKKVFGPSFNP